MATKTNKKDHHNMVNEALGFPVGDQFEKDLEALISAPDAASNGPVIIALVDLDHFMCVNDNFGYEEGDRILIEVGRHLSANLPEGAVAYRISGDEFGVLFNCDLEKEEVFLLMEKIRSTCDVKRADGAMQSISIGIAAAFDDAVRVPELVRKADSALFRAKTSGRNRIALAKEEKMVPKTSHYTTDQLSNLTKLSKREGIGEAILLREALDMLLKKYDI